MHRVNRIFILANVQFNLKYSYFRGATQSMATVNDLGIAVAEKAGQALHVMSVSGILDVPMDTVLRYMSRAEIGFYSI